MQIDSRQAPAPPAVALCILDEQQLVDMVVGAGIYCTRGVNTASQIQRVVDAYWAGQKFQLISLQDVPDDWLAFTSFTVGGGAWEHVPARLTKQGFQPDPSAPTASGVLARHLGTRFDVTFQAEAGGATVAALLTAAREGVPLIDACPTGHVVVSTVCCIFTTVRL